MSPVPQPEVLGRNGNARLALRWSLAYDMGFTLHSFLSDLTAPLTMTVPTFALLAPLLRSGPARCKSKILRIIPMGVRFGEKTHRSRYGVVLSGANDVTDDRLYATCLRAIERTDQFQAGTRLDRWLF